MSKPDDEALRQSEQRYRELIEQVKDYAVFRTDPHGVPTIWNEGVRRILGFSENEFLGIAIMPFIYTPEDLQNNVPQREMQEAVQNGTASNTRWLRRKDGTPFWAEGVTTALRSPAGDLIGFSKIFRDGTKAKLTEQALGESERRFRAVFNQQFQFMAILCPRGKLLEVNDLALEATGVSREEVLGHFFWDTPWWKDLPEMSKSWPERLASAATANGPVLSKDHFQTADGAVRVATAAITAVRNGDGKVEFFIVQATDITERDAAEKALRESEARKGAILESALDCIITIDYESRIVEVNQAFERVFGYRRSDVLGKLMAELIIPERYRAAHYRGLAQHLATGHGRLLGRRVELSALRSDGTEFPVELGITAIEGGERPLFTGTLRDITERRRAEADLRHSREQLQLISDTVPALISYVDTQVRYRMCNQAYTLWFGLPQDQLIGRHMRDVLGDKAWQAIQPHVEAALGGRTVDFETRAAYQHGGTRWIHAMYTPHRNDDGSVAGIVVMVTDITQSKHIQESLREREAVLRTVTSEARVGLVMIDKDRRYLFANQTYADILGLPDADIVGKSVSDVLAPVYDQIQPRLDRAFAGERVRYELHLPRHSKTGDERFYEVVYEPRTKDTAEPYVVVVIVDITERKQLQQTLERMVAERTASLNESMKAMETLLYTIAHDLRAPNRAVQGYAQLLNESYAPKLDEQGRFFINRISQTALRNERLIRDLLEFGRLMHAEFPCQPVNPEPVIAGALMALENEIKASDANIQADTNWPKVWGNDSALGHILTNLISNGIKYVAPGTHPKVRIFPKLVPASNPADPARVRICVEDNGIGLPADQYERVFEPFQRVASGKYEGTGMGLAIVHKAAERMGGTAGVNSTVGQGSCFWVELAAAD